MVINQNPEKQRIFSKENINTKRRQETYTDVANGNIKDEPQSELSEGATAAVSITKYHENFSSL